mmetsp:Transcript_39243/g.67945  ORF Transcript_39243/g.67945 Transcript_39243/m.67945 type:complete len:231 (-) Transcript_39243:2338-3030(-)
MWIGTQRMYFSNKASASPSYASSSVSFKCLCASRRTYARNGRNNWWRLSKSRGTNSPCCKASWWVRSISTATQPFSFRSTTIATGRPRHSCTAVELLLVFKSSASCLLLPVIEETEPRRRRFLDEPILPTELRRRKVPARPNLGLSSASRSSLEEPLARLVTTTPIVDSLAEKLTTPVSASAFMNVGKPSFNERFKRKLMVTPSKKRKGCFGPLPASISTHVVQEPNGKE